MKDIFISYSSKDENVVKKICSDLDAQGLSVWVSYQDIPEGQLYAEAIMEGLGEAQVVLVFISKYSTESQQVINEVDRAVNSKKKIIPIWLEKVDLTKALEYYLSSSQWMIYTPNDYKAFINSLIDRLKDLSAEKNNLQAEIKNKDINELLRLANDFDNKRDYNSAFIYYLAAAEKGNAGCQATVAYYYQYGYGVQQNLSEAVKWYELAVEQGNGQAYCFLGLLYEKGEGVPQDLGKAFNYGMKAVEAGFPNNEWRVGIYYEKGVGVEKNPEEAIKWYNKGTKGGSSTAMYYLSTCYDRGYGVVQDYSTAFEWMKQAYNQGESDTAWRLGYYIEKGLGTELNIREALKFYKEDADKGSTIGLSKYAVLSNPDATERYGFRMYVDFHYESSWYGSTLLSIITNVNKTTLAKAGEGGNGKDPAGNEGIFYRYIFVDGLELELFFLGQTGVISVVISCESKEKINLTFDKIETELTKLRPNFKIIDNGTSSSLRKEEENSQSRALHMSSVPTAKFRMQLRGYNKKEVDTFVDRVSYHFDEFSEGELRYKTFSKAISGYDKEEVNKYLLELLDRKRK